MPADEALHRFLRYALSFSWVANRIPLESPALPLAAATRPERSTPVPRCPAHADERGWAIRAPDCMYMRVPFWPHKPLLLLDAMASGCPSTPHPRVDRPR